MNDLLAAALVVCIEIGLIFRTVPADGKFYPLDVEGKTIRNGAGRIRLFQDCEGGQVWNHITKETRMFWAKSDQTLTPADQAKRRQRAEVERERANKELIEVRKKAAEISRKVLDVALPPDNNAYLLKKGVMPTDRLREIRLETLVNIIGYHPKAKGNLFTGEQILIVPVTNHQGVTSIEMIDEAGLKAGLANGQKKGCFWITGTLPDGDGNGLTLGIGEGVVTMITYNIVSGHTGIAALSCGNLKDVALFFRDKYPKANIVVISDIGNGETAAVEAAQAVNALIVKPTLPEGSTGSDINDVHTELGIDETRRQIEGAISVDPLPPPESENNKSSEKAGKLRDDYAANRFPVIPFPIEVFPQYMQLLIDKYCKALQCPTAFMAMNFLTVISGAVGNSITLAIKRSWKTAPFLWFGVIDISGAGKTHPQEAAMSPVRNLQSAEQTRYDEDQEEYKIEKALYERYKAEREPPPEPTPLRHYYTQSFTIESLVPMYKRSARGIVVYVDELAGLLKSMGQYKGGKGSDDEQLLSLYGCKSLKADRVTKGGFCRESGAAVMGGIQPGIFASVFGDKEQKNGMLFRFLPLLMNSTPPMFSDDDISQEDENDWSAIIDWMYGIPAEIDTKTGCIIRNVLIVSVEGKAAFTQFHNELSATQPFMPKRFSGYMAKLKDYCLKFICLLHLLECYKHRGLSLTVNKATVEGAVMLTRFFAGQALQLINGAVGHSDPFHDTLRKAIESLKGEVDGGKLLLSLIRLRMNEMLPADMQIDSTQNKRLATWLKEIGLVVTKRADNKSVVLIV